MIVFLLVVSRILWLDFSNFYLLDLFKERLFKQHLP